MRSLREVRDSLLAREKKRIAVAAAEDRPVLEAVKEAVQMGIAEATLCGDEAKIRQIAEEIEQPDVPLWAIWALQQYQKISRSGCKTGT